MAVYEHLVLVVVASCIFLLVFMRLRNGIAKAQLQNELGLPQKDIPILAYWLPYIGHGPEFAWSFDNLLSYGRSV